MAPFRGQNAAEKKTSEFFTEGKGCLMGCLLDFYGIFMGYLWDFMGFNGSTFMGSSGDYPIDQNTVIITEIIIGYNLTYGER